MVCFFKFSIKDIFDGSEKDCSNYIANALELPQSCTKPLDIYCCKGKANQVYFP